MPNTSDTDFLLTNDEDNTDESPDNGDQKLDLYDANKGLLKRDGGPYLDQVERETAELIRAQKEGRQPDLDNPPAATGTLLVPKHYLRETDASQSHVSAAAEQENEPESTVHVDTHSAFDDDPDPSQTDWDNDHQKVRSMENSASYHDAAEKLGTPDKEPSDEPVSKDAPAQPDSSANNENIVTGVSNSSLSQTPVTKTVTKDEN